MSHVATCGPLLDGLGPAVVERCRRVPAIPREEFRLLRRALSGAQGQIEMALRELERLEQFQSEGPSRNS